MTGQRGVAVTAASPAAPAADVRAVVRPGAGGAIIAPYPASFHVEAPSTRP